MEPHSKPAKVRGANTLTDAACRNAKPSEKPRKLADGHGLYLLVQPNGARYWRFKYRLAGREKLFQVGPYPEVSLTKARAERDKARELVREGKDPVSNRQAERQRAVADSVNTFGAVADEWLAKNQTKWSPAMRAKVAGIVGNNLTPHLKHLPVREVTTDHMLAVLRKIERRGALEVMQRARQYASAIFRHAVITKRAQADPTQYLGDALATRRVVNYRALPAKALPAFIKAVDAYPGYPQTRIALELLLLTIVRSGELRAAQWVEVDFEAAIWTIPAQRMKMRREHRVPLADRVLALLRELHKHTGHSRWLFPNEADHETHASENFFLQAIKRLGFKDRTTAHGLRSLASTVLNETGFRADVIERALAHEEKNAIRRAYNRAEYWEERVNMAQWWADYVGEARGGKVLTGAFRRAA
jgi:integrase